MGPLRFLYFFKYLELDLGIRIGLIYDYRFFRFRGVYSVI